MHNSHHEPPDTSLGFEQSDLAISGIVKGVVLYFIFTIGVGAVVLIGLFMFGVAQNPDATRFPPQHVPPDPNPVLQNNISARTDLWNLRARESYILSSAAFANPDHTLAHIPIDQAIGMAAAKGPNALSTLPPVGNTAESNPLPKTTGPGLNQSAAMPPNSLAGSRNEKPSNNSNATPKQGMVFIPRGAPIHP